MPFLIGTKKLVPAPIINIDRKSNFAQDGEILNTTYNITLNGTLLPNKGSPMSYGWHKEAGDPPTESFGTDDERFQSLLKKQALLREGFAATGYKIYYSSPGYPDVEFYPKFNSIGFSEDTWTIKSLYTVNLETPNLYVDSVSDEFNSTSGYSNLGLTSITDDYSIKERDENSNILEISRNVSATASFNYSYPTGQEPWKNARTWVNNRIATMPFQSGITLSISTIPLTSGFNFIEDETINKHAGSYTRNQRFILHRYNYSESRNVSRNTNYPLLGDNNATIESIAVNGTIQGYDVNNDPTGKILNARTYYSGMIQSIGPSVGALGRYVSLSTQEDLFLGNVNYSVNFINNTGSFYKHNYNVAYAFGANGLPSVTINGNIEGITSDQFYYGTGTAYNKFDMAMTGWSIINPTLKSLAFSTSLIPSGTLYANTPSAKQLSFDRPNGVLSYGYTFDFVGSGNLANTYKNEYTVEFSTNNTFPSLGGNTRAGLLIDANINGIVVGLSPNNDLDERIANAKAGYNAIDGSIFTFANNHYDLIGSNSNALNSGYVRRTISLNYNQGTLSYAATFNNNPPTSNSGVAVEDVTIDDTNASDIFAVQIIPGRSIGPIIQNIGTTTERRKNINIALTMYPKYPTGYYTYGDKSVPSLIASGIVSGIVSSIGTRGTHWFLAGDSENWNSKGGLYTRTINVTY